MIVAISSIRTKDYRIDRYELVRTLQRNGCQVKYIGRESDSEIHPDYKKMNVEFISIPIIRDNTNPLIELNTIRKVRHIIKKNKIDCLIIYGIRTFPLMTIAAKLAGVKNIILIVNGSGRLFKLEGVKGFLIKLFSYPTLMYSFLLSNKVLFQNQDDLAMIKNKRLLVKKNYGLINGSGVNLTSYKFTELPPKHVFLMVSRITTSKGVKEYMLAAKKTKEIHPNAVFLLVGPMEEIELENKINHSVENNIINYIGQVGDVRKYIEKSRYFVLPSYYPEGIPRSILEAMSMGRPIITTNSPGCKETVINKQNGFLIPPKNVESLYKAMCWMIENKEKVEKMAIKSREICEKKFDVHKINNKIISKVFK